MLLHKHHVFEAALDVGRLELIERVVSPGALWDGVLGEPAMLCILEIEAGSEIELAPGEGAWGWRVPILSKLSWECRGTYFEKAANMFLIPYTVRISSSL